MANIASNWENLSIYYANLSPVYLCSSLFTIVALFFTWWFSHNVSSNDINVKTEKNPSESMGESAENNTYCKEGDEDIREQALQSLTAKYSADKSMMRQIKAARQSAIEKQLTAGLSEEQIKKERETQASQLAAIYRLLREKEEQFQIRSMGELEDQLRLYKF